MRPSLVLRLRAGAAIGLQSTRSERPMRSVRWPRGMRTVVFDGACWGIPLLVRASERAPPSNFGSLRPEARLGPGMPEFFVWRWELGLRFPKTTTDSRTANDAGARPSRYSPSA